MRLGHGNPQQHEISWQAQYFTHSFYSPGQGMSLYTLPLLMDKISCFFSSTPMQKLWQHANFQRPACGEHSELFPSIQPATAE